MLKSLAVLSTFVIAPMAAQAAYPDHVVTAVVPFDVGGASDVISRIVATALAKELNQTIVVQNKAGAGGNVGIGLVAHAKADGYTLLFCSIATTENPALYRHLSYDPLKDIVPVAIFATSPLVIAVNSAKMPVTDFKGLIGLLQKNPGKYNMAAGGGGSRMSDELFMTKNNVTAEIVPYNSSGDAGTAVMAGETDFFLGDAVTMATVAGSGKVRALAVTGASRISKFPDVPTVQESGVQDYVDIAHIGVYAPAGTPPEILDQLHDAVNKVVASPDVQAQIKNLAYTATSESRQQFNDFYLSEIAKWKDMAEKAHIPPID